MSNFKETFIKIYNEKIKREGASEFLQWLETTDFFTAPASTRFHCSHENGLVEHSLNVYKFYRTEMAQRAKMFSGNSELDADTEEFIALCALLHDVCKCNYYTTNYRNVKNAKGEWVKEPYYTVENLFPYGHGEKSVWLIQRFMRLNVEESIAIRWHMGGFDESVKGGSYDLSGAYNQYPSAVLLHIADMKATYMLDS